MGKTSALASVPRGPPVSQSGPWYVTFMRCPVRPWPEAHSAGQRGLRVAAVGELLGDAEQQEGGRPQQGRADEGLPVQRHAIEGRCAEQAQQDDHERGRDEGPHDALPETPSKHPRRVNPYSRKGRHSTFDMMNAARSPAPKLSPASIRRSVADQPSRSW